MNKHDEYDAPPVRGRNSYDNARVGRDSHFRHRDDDFPEEDFIDSDAAAHHMGRSPWWTGRTGVTVALCLVGAVALGLAVFGMTRGGSKAGVYPALPSPLTPASSALSSAPEQAAPTAEPREIVVSVVGAVRQPGLARLVPGARVAEALDAAGGLVAGAETSGLNLAQRLQDGDQVVVGTLPPNPTPTPAPYSARQAAPQAKPTPVSGTALPSGLGSRCDCAGGQTPGDPGALPLPNRRRVDVNAAAVEELDSVPGIGKGIAQAIVQYRGSHGRFRNVDDLAKIHQVGAARLKKLRPYLRV